MFALKLTTIGNSVGVIFPREVREHLHVRRGETLYLTDAPGGGARLTAHDPGFVRQMEAMDKAAKRSRNVLAALAKL